MIFLTFGTGLGAGLILNGELYSGTNGMAGEALKIYDIVADRLGQGLAILVDLLNPEKIVIGSIFLRQEKLLRPRMEKILNKESLEQSLSVVEVLPAGLGEKLGDYAAVSVGFRAYQKK